MLQKLVCRASLGAALLAALATAAFARPLDDVKSTGVLRVIVYYDNPPFSFGPEDDVKGIDADLGRALADKLGVKPDIIARVAGEEVDDDIRSNIWQGPRTGGVKGDVMLHVPMDREFIARNKEAGFSNSYYHEQTIVAFDAERVPPNAGIEILAREKVAVQFSNSAHYFLAFAADGAYRNNVAPYAKFAGAVEAFLAGETVAIAGPRSEIEAALVGKGKKIREIRPEMPPTLKSSWTIGMAVAEDSRDLGYALGAALRELKASGELAAIFTRYGVTYTPPPTY